MLRNKIQGLEATDPDFPQLSLAERRKKLRIKTYIRLQIRLESGPGLATVTDLSLEGMRLKTSHALKEGQDIEVFFPEDCGDSVGSVVCKIVWVKAQGFPGKATTEAGLSFLENPDNMERSWVKYVLDQLGFDQQVTFQKRRFLRATGKIPARAFTALEGEGSPGEILNIGIGGALLALDEPLMENLQIHCELCLWRILPALRLPCRVLSVKIEDEDDEDTRFLHALLFLGMDTEQVKLLGNYVIYLINQSE